MIENPFKAKGFSFLKYDLVSLDGKLFLEK